MYISSYNQDPGGRGTGEGRGLHGSNRGSWKLPGGPWNLLGALGIPGRRLGSPRDGPGSSKRRSQGQIGPQIGPQGAPKSTIFGVGREIRQKVKIALPSRRQCNFRGSGTFEIELFLVIFGGQNQRPKGDSPKMAKIGSWGSLGAARKVPRAKMGTTRVPQGVPRGAQEAPKSSQNRGLFPNAPR